jgi:hypothetical protein
MFLYCSERLCEGVVYPVTIELTEKPLKVAGKVTWSNLDNCTSLNFGPAMGFYFVRIDEDKDRQSLREATVAHCQKPLRLRLAAERHTDSHPPVEAKASAPIDGTARNTQSPHH